MRRWIERWPPVLWPLMSLASLYILVGTSGRSRPAAFVVGTALALITFGIASYLALKPLPGRPRRPLLWPMIGLAAWYLMLGIAAATAGPEYAVAGLFAGVIPLTALALMVATIRRKTVFTEDGHVRDISAGSNTDPFPGIGLDDGTAMGDTPERADAKAEDQPGGRRFRREQEREGERSRSRG